MATRPERPLRRRIARYGAFGTRARPSTSPSHASAPAIVAAEDHPNPLAGRGYFSSSKLLLLLHGEKHYEFEFRGADKALQAHNLILWHMLEKGGE